MLLLSMYHRGLLALADCLFEKSLHETSYFFVHRNIQNMLKLDQDIPSYVRIDQRMRSVIPTRLESLVGDTNLQRYTFRCFSVHSL